MRYRAVNIFSLPEKCFTYSEPDPSAPEYARRGGSTDAGKALRALAAPPRRHPAPLHPLQGSCASSRAARRRQHGLPGASSSTKNPLRYLSDRTGDHARVKRQRDAEARTAAPARTSAGHAGCTRAEHGPQCAFSSRRVQFMGK